VHSALTLQLDMARQTLRGTCATTVRAISAPVTSVALDAVDLHITQVRQTGGKPVPFDYDGQRLVVHLSELAKVI
jgi:aminopeptidase N